MNLKKKRLAAAYLVSLLVNGVFWLAYAHELRTSTPSQPQPPKDNTAVVRALRLPPPFYGFPPPKLKGKPAPSAELKQKEPPAQSGSRL
jgi:hypothetical protein